MPSLSIFDLSVNRYSRDALGFFQTFFKYYPKGKDIPGIKRDGDFAKAYPTGVNVPSYPFDSLGDQNTAIVRQTWMQMANEFTPQALGTYHPDDSRLMLIDETDFSDATQGIITWTRVYATMPQPHDEWGSFSHPYQYLSSITSTAIKLGEQPFTVTSKVRCEYFHVRDLGSYPPIQAERFVQITDTYITRRGGGDWFVYDGFFLSNDTEVVAEDSGIGYWHYPIMYRKTRYVPAPSLAFWGSEFVIPGVSGSTP